MKQKFSALICLALLAGLQFVNSAFGQIPDPDNMLGKANELLTISPTKSMDPVDIVLSQTPETLEKSRKLADERGIKYPPLPTFNPAKLRIPKAFLQHKLNQQGGYQQELFLDINFKTMSASALGDNDPKDRDNISVELKPIGDRFMYDKIITDIYKKTWNRIDEENPIFDVYFTPHHLAHPERERPEIRHALDETVFLPKDVGPENVTYIHCGPLPEVVYCTIYDEPDARMWIQTPILKDNLQNWKEVRDSVRKLVQQFYLNP